MKDCLIKPCVENSKGEVVDSRLFQGLLSLFPGNSNEAWRHYDIATDPSFLEAYEDRISLDENGEVELQSYIEAIGMHESNFPMEEALNKELHKGSYSYQEAIEKVSAFNKKQPKDSKYIATIRPTEKKGVYKIFVAQNTDLEKATIKKVIKNQNIQDRIIGYLAQHGVSVSFTDGDSRYSTENVERNANGLWQLIEFSKTGKVSHYAEEAGHFIMGAMGDNPLAVRLETLLSDKKTRDAILDEEHITQDLGSNPAREAAGIVIGQALQDRLSNNILKRLTSRLITAAKKIFGKLSRNTVLQAVAEAEEIAQYFVESFITEGIPEGEKIARKKVETLYHREEKKYIKKAQELFQELESLRQDFKKISPNKKKDSNTKEKTVAELITELLQTTSDLMANVENATSRPQAIVTFVMQIKSIIEQVIGSQYANLILDPTQVNANTPITLDLPPLEAAVKMQEDAKRCMAYITLAQHVQNLGSLLSSFISLSGTKENDLLDNVIAQKKDPEKFIEFLTLLKNNKKLHKISSLALSAYEKKSQNIAAAFLQHIYGARFVEYNKGMLWNLSRGNTTVYKIGELQGETFEEDAIDIIKYIEQDEGVLRTFLGTLSNSKDISAQLIVKAIKNAKDKALEDTGKAYTKLIALGKVAKKLGINLNKFYVKQNGLLTGNLIYLYENPQEGVTYEIDWFSYKQDRLQLLNKAYRVFAEERRDGKLLTEIYAKSPDTVRSFVFEQFIQNSQHPDVVAYRDWESKSRETIAGVNKWIPRDPKYRHKTQLNQKELTWYKEYLQEFAEYKSWLGDANTMEDELAPQVRGTTLNTLGNIVTNSIGANMKSIGKSILNKMSNLLNYQDDFVNQAASYNWNCEDIDDHNVKEVRNFLRKKDSIRDTKSRILPVYYHRRLKDIHNLDTDLISSTIQFAAMAAHYKAMSEIVNPLEVTRAVLNERSQMENPKWYHHIDFWNKDSHVTMAINEYIDTQMYGINYGLLDKWFGKYATLVRMPIQKSRRLMTVVYLALNAFSAGINATVGFVEIFRHACNNQDFNLKDLTKATLSYVTYGIPAVVESIIAKDLTKMSLFARRVNALDDSVEFYKNYRSNNLERIGRWFKPSSLAMRPYGASEHMMQMIPYIAMANNIKLYIPTEKIDAEGNTIMEELSLWKAFEVINQYVEVDGKTSKQKTGGLFRTLFKSKEDYQKYKLISKLYDIIKANPQLNWTNILDNLPGGEQNEVFAILQKEEQLNFNKLLQYDRSKLLDILDTKLTALTFNDGDMADFSAKARIVTDNMHGVYDNANKSIMHRSIFGMLLLPFKGFAFGMINKRWGSSHYNVLLKRAFEGFHRATLKTGIHLGKDVLEIIFDGAKSFFVNKELRDQHFQNIEDSMQHILSTCASWIAPYTNKVFPNWTKKHIEIAGNEAQAYAFGETARAAALIMAMYYFKTLALTMAMGAEDDEYIDYLASSRDIEYQKAFEEFCNEHPNASNKQINDFNINYITSHYPQFEILSQKEKNYQEDLPYIRLEQDRRKDIAEKAREKATPSPGSGLTPTEIVTIKREASHAAIIQHVREEIKRLKRLDAQNNRPWWNLAAASSARVYNEISAFDWGESIMSEGSQLLDPYPLPFKAVKDVYNLISITKTGKDFQNYKLDTHEHHTNMDVHIAAHYFEKLGGEQNVKIAKHIRESKTITVSQAATIINLDRQFLIDNRPHGIKNTRLPIRKSTVDKALTRYNEYIKNTWKTYFPDKNLGNFVHLRGKEGRYDRYDPIGWTALKFKINPLAPIIYRSKYAEQSIRDYNFGRND